MDIIDYLGGEYAILNLTLLFICFILISSLIKNNYLRVFFSFVFSIFFVLQCISVHLIRSLVCYNFIIHLNRRDVFSILHLYKMNFIIIVLSLFFGLTILFYMTKLWHERVIKKYSFLKKIYSNAVLLFLVLSFILMSFGEGLIPKTRELISVFSIKSNTEFVKNNKALDLITPVELSDISVVTKQKKNIIILSLESYEKGYLSDKMSALTPNLRTLKNSENWSFIDIAPNEGSNWTSGSLYTTLTGYPAFFGAEHNSLFQNYFDSKIISVFDILNKLNYSNIYLVDDAKYAGSDVMLTTLGVDKIMDKVTLGSKYYDKDLFDKSKEIIAKNEKNNQNYTLFLSTLSTHAPDGLYDERMEHYVDRKNNNLQFMASAIDYMIGDLIAFLEKNNYLDNTSIYIMPDHLKMGSSKMFEGTGERGLFLLTNVPKNKIKNRKKQQFYQIDLPKLILDFAEIEHNHTFLSEQIVGDKNDFIKKHITELTKLNISGFTGDSSNNFLIPKLSKDYDKYKKDTLRFIAHAGGAIEGKTYTNSLQALDTNYKKGLRLFELDIRKTSDNKYVAVHEWTEWKEFTNYSNEVPVSHDKFMKTKILNAYSPLDINLINKWFSNHPDAILITDKVQEPKEFSEQFQFRNRLWMELFSWSAIEEAIDQGITPIVSYNVIEDLGKNAIEKLKINGIKYVAISRLELANNITLFEKLKNAGIKVYAYHINSKIDKDEDYMVKYEMQYYYGIYADNWSFK